MGLNANDQFVWVIEIYISITLLLGHTYIHLHYITVESYTDTFSLHYWWVIHRYISITLLLSHTHIHLHYITVESYT